MIIRDEVDTRINHSTAFFDDDKEEMFISQKEVIVIINDIFDYIEHLELEKGKMLASMFDIQSELDEFKKEISK